MYNIFTVSTLKLIIARLEVEYPKINTIEFLIIINKSTNDTDTNDCTNYYKFGDSR